MKKFFYYFSVIFLIFLSFCFGAGIGVVYLLSKDVPNLQFMQWRPKVNTKIYDCNGKLIVSLRGKQNRKRWVDLKDISPYMRKAIVAVEDERFYKHFGIDPIGILRAMVKNILTGRLSQGASTITQQLARNAFLTRKKSLKRKIKEMILAFQLEKNYTKDEILEMYLNTVYLGHGAWGIATASKVYFDKKPSQLTLAEAALLASLPQAPSLYDPFKEKGWIRVNKRKNFVLKKMYELGFISYDEYIKALNEPIILKKVERKIDSRWYFVDEVFRFLEKKLGSKNLYRSGLKIYTTLNLDWQLKVQEFVENYYFFKKHPEDVYQLGLVVMDPYTGAVRVMIGGRDYNKTKFNRVTQAHRQTGSAFKPIVYLKGLLSGLTQATIINDQPFSWEDPDAHTVWSPKNFANKYFGPVPLRVALQKSLNTVAARLAIRFGVKNIQKLARKMGIKNSKLADGPAIALGVSEITPIELATVYSTICSMGVYKPYYFVEKVVDENGKVIYKHEPKLKQVVDPQHTYCLIDMMKSVVKEGTGRRAYFGYPAAGKTGTTNSYYDAWFCGFTPYYVCIVYVGRDDHEQLEKRATGGKVAAPLWKETMKFIHSDLPKKDFPIPVGITFVNMCYASGKLATSNCPRVGKVAFIKGTEPKTWCDLHGDINSTSFTAFWQIREDQYKLNDKEKNYVDEGF